MSTIHGFELIREETIPELNTVARRYRHVQTGADLLSLQNDDENKTFGIAFRTPATDSTGLPHIMEHSVLCGSRKYPLKEPFTELLKGSLKTFLNAFTSADRTVYPVASANLQDFYNLVDVYLDAVFFPRITPQTLAQEGWHYELNSPDDALSFKGVVFNEMKGAYSSPDSLLYRYARQHLFPDTNYANDSGGDPAAIPDLTYAQFKRFHDTFYHPANAMIFFAGDDDPSERLRRLDAYLGEFAPLAVDAPAPVQPPFAAPRQIEMGYDAGDGDGEGKAMLLMEWALPVISPGSLAHPAEMLLLSILSYALVGASGAPLHKALLDSGLGESMAGGGFGDDLHQMTFSAGLKGIDPANAPAVEALILATLARLAESGLDPEGVEAAINTLEFNLRENNTGSFPRGLAMMLRVLRDWAYGADPIDHLAFEESLGQVKALLAQEPTALQERMRSLLVDNPHRITLLLQPDTTVGPARAQAEAARLAAAQASLSAEEAAQVVADTHSLRVAQETPDSAEALATIPTLTLADLEQEEKNIPSTESTLQGSRVLHHDLFTNGIVYLDLGFDLHTLPQDLVAYVPLFSRALLEMGSEHSDYVKLNQRIDRKTGGIWSDRMESARLDQAEAVAWLLLRGKATVAQVPDMLALMGEILGQVRLDNQERFRQLVLESKARRESRVIPGGHAFVQDRLSAAFNEADWLSELWGGVSSLLFLRGLAQEVEQDWPGVLAKLERIRAILLNRQAMLCNVTVDAGGWDAVRPALEAFLAELPAAPVQAAVWQRDAFPAHEGLTIPAQVNYVGKGVNLYDLGYAYHGSMIAISNFLRNGYIWDKIRVQGGAYGGFVSFDRHSGIYSYLSYRDPNLQETLAVYDSVGSYLRRVDLPQEELTKSIIGAIGRLDAHQLPDAKGFTALVRTLLGSTQAERQRIRDEVLATTVADFRRLGEVLGEFSAAGRVVVLGAADAIAQANAGELGSRLAVQKVL